jgi:Pyridine nucleotide-disulphide oxidoreductase
VDSTDVVILGAGPHGLAAAAHLRRAGVECRVFGEPMSFWHGMPIGMLLRSNWTATCIAEHEGPLSLDSYRAATGANLATPVPLDAFIEYGEWVAAQVAPDVDRRRVLRVEHDNGQFLLTTGDDTQLRANRLVVAAGIAPFTHRPDFTKGLPPELVSHTDDHSDLGVFKDSDVLVIGGGQSALESAALMHESGASVSVAVRKDHLNWLHGGKYHRMLGRLAPLVYAPTDVGPMGISRVVAVPDLFRRLPRRAQDPMATRAIRPAGATWLKPRLEEVPIHLNARVRSAQPVDSRVRVEFEDGKVQIADHLLLGTGYRVDIAKYSFLDPSLVNQISTRAGYPLLRRGMESSVPRLHFLGAPAAYSFGPIMRFVAGGWFGATSLTRAVKETSAANEPEVAGSSSSG